MRSTTFLSLLAVVLTATSTAVNADLTKEVQHLHKRSSPDVYNIKVKNLTPEDTVWDTTHKLFYQSNLWKGMVSVWNPKTKGHYNLHIPGVTSSGQGDQQMAGLSLDLNHKRLYACAKNSNAFNFGDQSTDGPSSFHAFNLPVNANEHPVWSVKLLPVQKALLKKFGGSLPFGNVDSAQDSEGNSYVVFALGMPAVAKISKDGKKVTAFSAEKPNGSQRPGYTGVVYVPSANKIIAYGGPRPLTAFHLSSSDPSKPHPVKIHGSFGSLDGTEKITYVKNSNGKPRLLGTKAPEVYSFRSDDNFESVYFKTFTRDEFQSNSLTVVTQAEFGGGHQIYGGGAYFGGPYDGRVDFPLYRISNSLLD